MASIKPDGSGVAGEQPVKPMERRPGLKDNNYSDDREYAHTHGTRQHNSLGAYEGAPDIDQGYDESGSGQGRSRDYEDGDEFELPRSKRLDFRGTGNGHRR